MRKGTVLFVMLGLSACLCWAFSTAIAEQPVGGAATKSPSAAGQPAPKSVTKVDPGAKQGVVDNQVLGSSRAPMSGVGRAASDATAEPGYPVGYEPRAHSPRAIDPSKLIPIPAGVERQRSYAGVDGPRDGRDPCLPAGGDCGPIVFKNLIQEESNYYTDALADQAVGDDCWLVGTERSICQVIIASYGGDGTYSYEWSMWTNCPAEGGAVMIYGPISSGTRPAGYEELAFSVPGVEVDTFVWISATYTGVTATQAGPIIGERAEIGFTDNSFGVVEGTPPSCGYYWYGGSPWASLAYQLSAAGDATGKCCYNDCADCVDTTYGDCLAQPGNPEFLLGASCATGPGCQKGACCTAAGTCLDNVDPNDPNCAVGTWTLGSTCTYLAPYTQKFCAPPPDNDTCGTAELIEGTCATKYFNTAGASVGVDDPNDPPFTSNYDYYTVTCLAVPETPADSVPVANNIWYKYQIPTTYDGYEVTLGQVVITTVGSQFDTVLTVWGVLGEGGADCAGTDCSILTTTNEIECNDDIVAPDYAHQGHVQASYVLVPVSEAGMQPGSCIYIMVGGLNQANNEPGGPGQLNLDFYPLSSPWNDVNSGICCTATGCFFAVGTGDCEAAGGYLRAWTDFYEDGYQPPDPFSGTPNEGARASGCCHGDFGSCQEGEYCGKPIVLSDANDPDSNLVWTGDVHRVTYFKFAPRYPSAATDPYEPDPNDPNFPRYYYYITIDTCGSEFDTVLSVYGGTLIQDPSTNNYGECDIGAPIARNDDCSLSTYGAEGRVSCAGVTTTSSCLCLKVEGLDGLLSGNDYYIGVGRKDTRAIDPNEPFNLRVEGVDPVVNYPIVPAVGLQITMKDTYPNCEPCDKQCCKGDVGNGDGTYTADGAINGKDIADMVKLLCSGDAGNLDCQAANDVWCRANMNMDPVVDIDDIPGFVNALLIPWPCDETPYCFDPNDPNNPVGLAHCQPPDYPTGGGGIISDVNGDLIIADNFVSFTGGQITRVCWWGVYSFYSGGWSPCTPTGDDDFTITFYTNALGRPDTVIAQYSNIKVSGGDYTLTKTATGRNVVNAPEYKYEVTGLPPVAVAAGECVWIEIHNNTGTQDCWWLWELQSNSGDTVAAALEEGYYRSYPDTDVAFCVNIPIHNAGCARECLVPCPVGATDEGEEDCYEGFVDTTNGGCYLASPLFTDITSGQTFCGTTGIFPAEEEGFVTRDSDWYRFTITGSSVLTTEFAMDFSLLYFIVNAGTAPGSCTDWTDNIVEGWGISPCATGVSIRTNLITAGTYYLLIIPDFDYTFEQPCGSKYTIEATWEPVALGACCSGATCAATESELACCARGAAYTWYKGQVCGSFSCPTAGLSLLWDNFTTCSTGTPPANAYGSQFGGTWHAQVADDFTFAAASTVTRARWVGSYYNSGTNTLTGFKVLVYNNNVDRPTGAGLADPSPTAIFTTTIPIANVTQTDNEDGTTTYEGNLPASFAAAASTTYWVAIEAQVTFPPQWGISRAEVPELGSYPARRGFPAAGTAYWNGTLGTPAGNMAFKLYGTTP